MVNYAFFCIYKNGHVYVYFIRISKMFRNSYVFCFILATGQVLVWKEDVIKGIYDMIVCCLQSSDSYHHNFLLPY